MTENLNLPGNARKKQLIALAAAVGVAAIGATAYWTLYAAHFVATDNAYAGVEVAQVTPSVGGTVSEVLVTDTQAVKKGDVLVRIDPSDARLALAQAEADEKRAAAQLKAAEADFERAKIDLQRREALAASGSVSGDELTRARNAHATAQANLSAAQAAEAQARANRGTALGTRETNAALIAGTTEENNPEVALARARRDQAAIDLERTVVRAPVDGIVAKRQVQLGQRVQAGMPLLAVVPIQEMHVDANFKEVQLEKVDRKSVV